MSYRALALPLLVVACSATALTLATRPPPESGTAGVVPGTTSLAPLVPAAAAASVGGGSEPAFGPAASQASAAVGAPVPTASAAAPGASPAPDVPPAGSLPPRYRVLAIGDSLSDPRSHGGGYLKVLEERCPGLHMENLARGGHMVNQMRRRLLAALEARDDGGAAKEAYTHLIVFGGVNDVLSDETAKRTPRSVARDLGAMYAAGRARGLTVVAITLAPWGGMGKWYNPNRHAATLEVNRWIREQAAAGTVDVVVDAYALLGCQPPTHLCPEFVKPFNDGLHFGPAGHRRLGEALVAQAFPGCG